MKKSPAIDDDGEFILPGDSISFSYGIPPVRVVGPVVTIDGAMWVLTPGHTPDRCRLAELRDCVGSFYKHND